MHHILFIFLGVVCAAIVFYWRAANKKTKKRNNK